MKNFIFIVVILFGTSLLLGGCYTYLSLSDGAQLAEVPYDEPYFPPPPPEPPRPCPKPHPPRHGDYIPPYYIPPEDPYQRPNDIADLRNNDGNGKNPETERRR